MQGYTDTIRKYAANETHVGLLDNPDGTGEVGLSGQEVGKRLAVRFTLKICDDRVEQIRFQVFGCGFTIAACAAAAELSEGRSLQEIQTFTPNLIDSHLGGLPHERDYCAELANQALQAAIASARNGTVPVQTDLATKPEEDHGPLISPDDPLYCALLKTPAPSGSDPSDRQLLAGLLTVGSRENCHLHAALGLTEDDLYQLLDDFFPACDRSLFFSRQTQPAPEINTDVLEILLSHVPCDTTGGKNRLAEWLARIIAARAAHPGHLWVAMGFFERPQLTAAIRRHLPTLAEANNKGMRWKRYLFKQVCDMNGGVMCKSPTCGDCSDYSLCFAPD